MKKAWTQYQALCSRQERMQRMSLLPSSLGVSPLWSLSMKRWIPLDSGFLQREQQQEYLGGFCQETDIEKQEL